MGSPITFTGLASGIDTAAWVEALVKNKKESTIDPLSVKKTQVTQANTTLSGVQSSYNSFRTAIEKLTDSRFGGSFDIFSKTKVESSNSDIVTATSTSAAAISDHKISVARLASATSVMSREDALSVKPDSKITGLKDDETAEYSVYVNGNKSTFTVNKDTTLQDLLDNFNSLGVDATYENGIVTINQQEGDSVVIGSSTDDISKFNISNALNLDKTDTGYQSYQVLSHATSNSLVKDVLGDDAMGTFTIGNAEFTIDENTTFDSLINEINASEDANVTASFDKNTGRLKLESDSYGSFNINIEAGTSSFTDKMGYTQGGAVTAQELGSFAMFTIDGQTRMATSNTITSDISNIEGVTFTLKGVSTEEAPETTIGVKQDTADLVSAVKSFVTAYNNALDKTDSATATGAALNGDSALNSMRNSIRRMATSKDVGADDKYSILASIGLSTGKATNDVAELSDHLQFDEKKFLEAFADDPEAVKKLLIGGENNEGVLNKVYNTVDQALSSKGYFTTRHNSIDKQISSYDKRIQAETTKMQEYQARLQKQFSAMEDMIANFKSAYSQALGQIGG